MEEEKKLHIEILLAERDKLTAERDKFINESESLRTEKSKLEAEKKEINSRINQPWYRIRLVSVIQATIAGFVAGIMIWAFAITHIKALYELQEELEDKQLYLEKKNNELSDKNKNLLFEVEELKNRIVQAKELEPDNEALAKEAKEQLEALSVLQQAISKVDGGNWFPVVASTYNEEDLISKLEIIKKQKPEYQIHIYKTTDKRGTPVWAVSLGGYLDKHEARKRVAYAKDSGIADDAYIWQSEIWGNDIYSKYTKYIK
ncbi:MAG: hypothetical protein AB2551_13585 [Candidatus Thiodiazotropha sp.]